MAKQTSKSLKHTLIYSIFIRNFTQEGTFKAVVPELDRIKGMGVDIIWFLPFYPIGEKNRKGKEGSPYSIQDYRQVDPKYGTMEDLMTLIEEIHQRDMKVMIDIVFNHTSPDSRLSQEHPEWFYKTETGNFGNQVGDWTDIIDLDYEQVDLWSEQIENLKFWAKKVDGFRCDVAPLVPLDFWLKARNEVSQVNPQLIWLSESVHPGFIRDLRSRGMVALSDSEIYQAFDMTYDYDVRDEFEAYLKGDITLSQYIYRLNIQDYVFPDNYIKMRNLENHDNLRASHLIPNRSDLINWLAFTFFQKGSTLIYNGQEVLATETPSLFNIDPIDWNRDEDISDEIGHLASIQKKLPMDELYRLYADEDKQSVIAYYGGQDDLHAVGIFNLKEHKGQVSVELADGDYVNLVNSKTIHIKEGKLDIEACPIIIIG